VTPNKVLVVGRMDIDVEPLVEFLAGEGFDVLTCGGPKHVRCPALSGRDCHLRDWADVAIIYLSQSSSLAQDLPLTMCAAKADRAVIALEGQVDAPQVQDGVVMVGALRGVRGITAAIRELVK
jgi:hypothetical protein